MNKKGFATPVRILISLILSFIIVSVLFLSWKKIEIVKEEMKIKRQINEILEEVEIMIASGDAREIYNPKDLAGDKRKVEISLSGKVEFLAFGLDPEKDERITGEGNCIFYKIRGGNKKVVWLENIFFRKGKIEEDKLTISDEGVIIKSGKYSLIFELVENISHDRYILIYPS